MTELPAGVYLVPTPIGNLRDLTLRALDVLQAAHRIACEDTRHTGKLLQAHGVAKPLVSLHMHNEHARVAQLLDAVAAGEVLAVVSDAGTPGISDPGFLIAREAIRRGLRLECLPGPTAFVPALVASGLPLDRFVFEGFLPKKKGRQTRLQALAAEPRTLVLYESPHQLVRTLADLAQHLGADRPAAVARELTKLHEDLRRDPLAELHRWYSGPGASQVKGELVLVVAGAAWKDAGAAETPEVDA